MLDGEMIDEASRKRAEALLARADAAGRRRGTRPAMRWIREFSEGSRDQRELLGGKGAGVAEMTRVLGPERVPAGFTITTEACVAYMQAGGELPPGLAEEVDEALAALERRTGKALGDPEDPLLVSVRSGARVSMPGMLDTVLNLGLNDESVAGLAASTGERVVRLGLLSALRADVRQRRSRRSPRRRSSERWRRHATEQGVERDTELDVEELRELTATFKVVFEETTGDPFPTEPREQLAQAIEAVFDSWDGERAVAYRRINGIPDDWGTAVNVQRMVFGNRGETSGSGVAFSRDERTGSPHPLGRLPRQRPGRGRRRRHPGPRGPRGARRPAARGPRRAARRPRAARVPLRGHAGRRVHDRGRAPVPAADTSRQAPRPGGRPVRRRRGRGGAPYPRGGAD